MDDEPVVKVNTEPTEEPLIGPEDVIVIDQAEFEKDYEVK